MILQILVSLFLFHLSYDALTLFLWPEYNDLPNKMDVVEKPNGLLVETTGSVATPWAVAAACLLGLIAARLFLKRRHSVPQDVIKDIAAMVAAEDKEERIKNQPYRSESFITCRPSKISLLESNAPENKLNVTEDYQLLMDDLRYSMEQRMDDMLKRVERVQSESSVWVKRMEQIESELSFIHHQIFIMLNNMKLSVVTSTDVPGTKQQLETIKDLNKILEEVKQEFKADEALKNKMVEGGEIEEQKEPVIDLVESVIATPPQSLEDQSGIIQEDILQTEQYISIITELQEDPVMITEVENVQDSPQRPRSGSLWVRSRSNISSLGPELKLPPAEPTSFGPTIEVKSKSLELAEESIDVIMQQSERRVKPCTPVKINNPPEDKLLQMHENTKYQEMLKVELDSIETSKAKRNAVLKDADNVIMKDTTHEIGGQNAAQTGGRPSQMRKQGQRYSPTRQKGPAKGSVRYTVIK